MAQNEEIAHNTSNADDHSNSDTYLIAQKCMALYDEPVTEDDGVIFSELKVASELYGQMTEIAHGGMKRIFKAFENKTSRFVAYAKLRDDINLPPESKEVFLREARLTARLEHPNIITIHDIGLNETGDPYFTMDLKRGDSLTDILKALSESDQDYLSKYPLEARLEIFSKICDAVSHAHARQVLHLDIKPDNVQVGEHGDVLLCDWGLGKIILSDSESAASKGALTRGTQASEAHKADGDDLTGDALIQELLVEQQVLNHQTSFNAIKGTPGYMPPEQVIKNGMKDKRSDIYGLGCLLYSLCALKPPYSGTPDQILKKTEAGLTDPLPSTVPDSLTSIIDKALATDPELRYQSVELLKKDLSLFMTGHAPSAEDASPFKQFALFLKRHQRVAAVSMLALILLSALSAIFFIRLYHQHQQLIEQSSALSIKTNEAIEAKQLAQTHLQRAEYVAEQFRKEKAFAQTVSQNLSDRYMREFNTLGRTFYDGPVRETNEAINSLKEVLKLNPDNAKAQKAVCELEFIKQYFQGVIEFAEKGYPVSERDLALARTYTDYRIDRTLREDKFIELLSILAKDRTMDVRIMRLLAVDQELRVNSPNPIKFVLPVLKAWNPNWSGDKISYNPDTLTVRINSPDIKILGTSAMNRRLNRCPLHHLNIHFLDLSDSGIYDLGHINKLNIHRLSLAGTQIDTLRPLIGSTVRELVINKGQFTQEQLNQLPSRIQVFESK